MTNPSSTDTPKVLSIQDLSRILHRSSATIAAEVTKAPHKLPPRLKLPGSRKVLWLEDDVKKWINEHRTSTPT